MLLALVFAAFHTGAAEDPDTRYLRIFSIIEKADSQLASGATNDARATYQESQSALLALRKENPNWNSRAVAYRLNYVAGKIASLTPPTPRPGQSSAGTEDASSGSDNATASAAPADEHGLRLLSPGSEPRRELRYDITPGTPQTVRITVNSSIVMGGAQAGAGAIKIPAIEMIAKLTPTAVTQAGNVDYELVFEDVQLREDAAGIPQLVEAMKASLAGMKGVRIRCTMTSRGVIEKAEPELPPNAGPEAKEAIDQLTQSISEMEFILPGPAVGVGARWEVRRKTSGYQGVEVDEATTHTLTSLDGERFEINSTQTQRAANQTITVPMMADMAVNLTRLTGSGKTTATVDLGKIMPTQGTTEMRLDLALRMEMDGRSQSMNMRMENNVRVEAK